MEHGKEYPRSECALYEAFPDEKIKSKSVTEDFLFLKTQYRTISMEYKEHFTREELTKRPLDSIELNGNKIIFHGYIPDYRMEASF